MSSHFKRLLLAVGLVVAGFVALVIAVPLLLGSGFCGLVVWGVQTEPLAATVVDKQWSCRGVTRAWRPVVSQWWGDELTEQAGTPPTDEAEGVGSIRDIRDCVTRRDIVSCKGQNCFRYVDRAWCRYDTEEWIEIDVTRTSGSGASPPKCPGPPPDEPTSRYTEELTLDIHVSYTDGDDTRLHVETVESTAEYQLWKTGDPVSIDRNNFGKIVGIVPLEATGPSL